MNFCKSFKYKLVNYPYSGMWLQKALPTFDEPFVICFDLKDHRLFFFFLVRSKVMKLELRTDSRASI